MCHRARLRIGNALSAATRKRRPRRSRLADGGRCNRGGLPLGGSLLVRLEQIAAFSGQNFAFRQSLRPAKVPTEAATRWTNLREIFARRTKEPWGSRSAAGDHAGRVSADERRDRKLARVGYRTLRVSAELVARDLRAWAAPQ